MSIAKNTFYNAVRTALEKDGWTITHDPLELKVGGIELKIDLDAVRDGQVIGAVRENRKIAVEIKSFVGSSNTHSFHNALGQFVNYRMALEQTEPDRALYLAVPTRAFNTFFQLEFPQQVIATYQVPLLVYRPTRAEIDRWL